MILWLLSIIVFVMCSIFLTQYHWSRRRLYLFANILPGPTALPIVGNGLSFLGETKDLLKTIEGITRNYPKPLRFWLGPTLVVYFSHPKHIEKILLSKSLTDKHDLYDMVKIYLGESLVSGSGEKWRQGRKVISPLLNTKFIQLCTKTFGHNIDICMENLEKRVGAGTFNVHKEIQACCVDIIGESFMGININLQKGENLECIHTINQAYDLVYKRIMKPWYQSDFIFTLSGNMKKQIAVAEVINEFYGNIIRESRKRIKSKQNDRIEVDDRPIVDQMIEGFEKGSIFLEDQELIHHAITLFLASEDTIVENCSFLCLLLGMYPQYQAMAATEIRSVFGDKPRQVEHEDLGRLQYLEMCIKDVARLFPIAPYIIRKTTEDFDMDEMTIPKGSAILVSIYEVHRDRKYWEQPSQFFPDHFLPETAGARHPYAYVPFSAGPRSCIGKHFAKTVLKMLVANILQRFEIEADGKISDIELKADISVRAVNGYNVRLKKRVWQ